MVPEQPVIIEHICAIQILSNIQFSTKVLKCATLFLFQSLVRQTFLALRQNCKSFYLDFFFTWFIVISEEAQTFLALRQKCKSFYLNFFLNLIYYCKWGGSPIGPMASWVSTTFSY